MHHGRLRELSLVVVQRKLKMIKVTFKSCSINTGNRRFPTLQYIQYVMISMRKSLFYLQLPVDKTNPVPSRSPYITQYRFVRSTCTMLWCASSFINVYSLHKILSRSRVSSCSQHTSVRRPDVFMNRSEQHMHRFHRQYHSDVILAVANLFTLLQYFILWGTTRRRLVTGGLEIQLVLYCMSDRKKRGWRIMKEP